MDEVLFAKEIDTILDNLDFSKLGKNVGIKLHFGERGCVTYVNPEIARKVYNKVVAMHKQASLIECNVLYKGSRSNSTDHIKTAREHGFDMPIDILDGEYGNDNLIISGCKLGKGIQKYDSLIVISHFKGHIAAGFGGALKNVGMGLGSRAGKLDMHAGVHPTISEACIGCGLCIQHCNAKAITLKNGKAKIDPKLCEGCAMCIAVCNNGAARVPFAARTNEDLQLRIAEYAKAVLSKFPDAIFINVLEKITKDCDCFGIKQRPVMNDVGILASTNIVAVDKASLDLANKHSGRKFSAINNVDKEMQITQAVKLGLGSGQYKLREL